MLADLIYDTVSDLTWKLGSNYPITLEVRDARRKLVGMGQLDYNHDSASFKMRQLTFDELFESTEPAPKQFPLARPVIRSLAQTQRSKRRARRSRPRRR